MARLLSTTIKEANIVIKEFIAKFKIKSVQSGVLFA